MPDVTLDVDPGFEHGVLLDQGSVEVAGTALAVADLAFQAAGGDCLEVVNRGQSPARVLLLGGPPFPEQLVMWWNFVGRSHEDIAAYRQMWQDHDDRFGAVRGYQGAVVTPACPAAAKRDVASAAQSRGIEESWPPTRPAHPPPSPRSPTASASPLTARRSASPSTPIATANGSSPTPRSTTRSRAAVSATILIGEALQATRDAGLRIVPVCPMVAAFVKKHDEYTDVVDPVDTDVKRWLANS